ncbi:hypothetical protein LX36DRAFT_181269 [Colletotrichum falcatum]|nr:hypothetical protein LX36DRAFT_181269 [Colletotrichum falcatum]
MAVKSFVLPLTDWCVARHRALLGLQTLLRSGTVPVGRPLAVFSGGGGPFFAAGVNMVTPFVRLLTCRNPGGDMGLAGFKLTTWMAFVLSESSTCHPIPGLREDLRQDPPPSGKESISKERSVFREESVPRGERSPFWGGSGPGMNHLTICTRVPVRPGRHAG